MDLSLLSTITGFVVYGIYMVIAITGFIGTFLVATPVKMPLRWQDVRAS